MALTLISTHTASSSASIDITSGITSAYSSYEFHCVNIHAATDSTAFGFQFNVDGGSGFNEPISSTHFKAEHDESDSALALNFSGAGNFQDNGTAFQRMGYDMEIDNDEGLSGTLTLYAPSSTTYVKHFLGIGNYVHHSGKYTQNFFVAGYANVAAAIDEISFKMESGAIASGTIKMFGVG